MRSTVDHVSCDTCGNTSAVGKDQVPSGWARFYNNGPRGTGSKEVLLCEGCVCAVECFRRDIAPVEEAE